MPWTLVKQTANFLAQIWSPHGTNIHTCHGHAYKSVISSYKSVISSYKSGLSSYKAGMISYISGFHRVNDGYHLVDYSISSLLGGVSIIHLRFIIVSNKPCLSSYSHGCLHTRDGYLDTWAGFHHICYGVSSYKMMLIIVLDRLSSYWLRLS